MSCLEGTGAFTGRNVGTTAAGKQRVKMGDVTVTTTDAAAAWHVHKRLTLAAFMISAVLGLSGCGTTNLLGGGDSASAVLTEPAANNTPATGQTRVAIAPIIGAPDAVGRQLTTQLASAAEQERWGFGSSRDAGAVVLSNHSQPGRFHFAQLD